MKEIFKFLKQYNKTILKVTILQIVIFAVIFAIDLILFYLVYQTENKLLLLCILAFIALTLIFDSYISHYIAAKNYAKISNENETFRGKKFSLKFLGLLLILIVLFIPVLIVSQLILVPLSIVSYIPIIGPFLYSFITVLYYIMITLLAIGIVATIYMTGYRDFNVKETSKTNIVDIFKTRFTTFGALICLLFITFIILISFMVVILMNDFNIYSLAISIGILFIILFINMYIKNTLKYMVMLEDFSTKDGIKKEKVVATLDVTNPNCISFIHRLHSDKMKDNYNLEILLVGNLELLNVSYEIFKDLKKADEFLINVIKSYCLEKKDINDLNVLEEISEKIGIKKEIYQKKYISYKYHDKYDKKLKKYNVQKANQIIFLEGVVDINNFE